MAGSIYPSHTKKGRRWRALYRDAAGHQYVSEGFRRTSGLAGSANGSDRCWFAR
jgi:hypothetical protein